MDVNFKNIAILASIPVVLFVIGVAGYFFSAMDKFHPNIELVQSIYDEIKACPSDINKEKAEQWFGMQLEKEKALKRSETALNNLIKVMSNSLFLLAALSLWQGVALLRRGRNASNTSLSSTPQSGAS